MQMPRTTCEIHERVRVTRQRENPRPMMHLIPEQKPRIFGEKGIRGMKQAEVLALEMSV